MTFASVDLFRLLRISIAVCDSSTFVYACVYVRLCVPVLLFEYTLTQFYAPNQ